MDCVLICGRVLGDIALDDKSMSWEGSICQVLGLFLYWYFSLVVMILIKHS